MNKIARNVLAIILCGAFGATGAVAQSGFGVTYVSQECNNEPVYLTDNDIVCTAVFADTNVWDFLNGLPRRITLDELAELNPGLEEVGYETVISGITFVRVR